MVPFNNAWGTSGPPIPLRDLLEKIDRKRTEVLNGTSNFEQLADLMEKAEDLADVYDIEILWFENSAGLYGAFHGSFYFSQPIKSPA